jgi:hypothetical protein
VPSANFALTAFYEDEMRRPTLNAVPYGLQTLVTGSYAHYGRRIGPTWMVAGANQR